MHNAPPKQVAKASIRQTGAKPGDRQCQAAKISLAITELKRSGAAFTVADIAERSGVSRSTIYRSSELRELIGVHGDCVRPVEQETHEQLLDRHEALKTKNRQLRRQLLESEQRWAEMRERTASTERRLKAAERQIAFLTEQHSGNSTGSSGLVRSAARLTSEQFRQARRQIASVLHPDLYTKDPAAAALATELLKSLNALAE